MNDFTFDGGVGLFAQARFLGRRIMPSSGQFTQCEHNEYHSIYY